MNAPAKPLPNAVCPVCGAANRCAPAASGSFDTPCWCRDLRIDPARLVATPEAARGLACLCPRCAGATVAPDESQ
ncbi:MAG: cysteine-rich CWC family protein [Burkholderiaceae bacterium]